MSAAVALISTKVVVPGCTCSTVHALFTLNEPLPRVWDVGGETTTVSGADRRSRISGAFSASMIATILSPRRAEGVTINAAILTLQPP
jgi:hypothetical protein